MKDMLPPNVIAMAAPAFRATNVFCIFDGGAFMLTFSETRNFRKTEDGRFQNDVAEMAKVMLSPVAMQFLRQQVDQAVRIYEKAIGPMPDPAAVQNKVGAEVAIQQLQSGLKPGEPPAK